MTRAGRSALDFRARGAHIPVWAHKRDPRPPAGVNPVSTQVWRYSRGSRFREAPPQEGLLHLGALRHLVRTVPRRPLASEQISVIVTVIEIYPGGGDVPLAVDAR